MNQDNNNNKKATKKPNSFYKARRIAQEMRMQQREMQMQQFDSESNNVPNTMYFTSRKQQARKHDMTSGTLIPLAQSTNIYQNTNGKFRTQAVEQIGVISFTSNTAIDTVWLFDINPLLLTNTRLQAIAKTFQKYQVKNLKFTIVTNLPTTAGGTIAIGTSENPDQIITNSQQTFSLSGAQLAPLYVPTEVSANFNKKLLNLDATSKENMMTTASRLAISLQNTSNISGTTSIPILMNWDIEFSGTAIQETSSPVPTTYAFPATKIQGKEPNYAVGLSKADDESFNVPVTPQGVPLSISPQQLIKTPNGGEEVAQYIKLNQVVTGVPTYFFYANSNDLENNLPINPYFTDVTNFLPRFVANAMLWLTNNLRSELQKDTVVPVITQDTSIGSFGFDQLSLLEQIQTQTKKTNNKLNVVNESLDIIKSNQELLNTNLVQFKDLYVSKVDTTNSLLTSILSKLSNIGGTVQVLPGVVPLNVIIVLDRDNSEESDDWNLIQQ